MNTKNLFFLVEQLEYDRRKLLSVFEQCATSFRVKGLPWEDNQISLSDAKCLVVQYGEHMMLDLNKKHLSVNLLDFNYVKSLVNKFNFDHYVSPENLDLLWYKKGFSFVPHVDHYSASTVMFPIYPEDGGAPIDFYHKEGLTFTKGVARNFENELDSSNIIHTHYYSTVNPTIFNSHEIHGIRPITKDRIYFRIRLNENFSSLYSKYKNNTLLK